MTAEQHARRSTDPIPAPVVRDLTERYGLGRALLLWEQIDRDYRTPPSERTFEMTLPMDLE